MTMTMTMTMTITHLHASREIMQFDQPISKQQEEEKELLCLNLLALNVCIFESVLCCVVLIRMINVDLVVIQFSEAFGFLVLSSNA